KAILRPITKNIHCDPITNSEVDTDEESTCQTWTFDRHMADLLRNHSRLTRSMSASLLDYLLRSLYRERKLCQGVSKPIVEELCIITGATAV
ncbi:hypothetical protein IWW34DRAFT_640348, partial [Fusarium oxysporum f. sp. albedinis]